MSLFLELRRRNVFRIAAAYIVVGWLITEIATTLLPVFGAPDWVAQVVVIVLALGFLPAVVFAWVFELTPDGLKKESEVPRDRSITSHTGRRLDYITIAAIVAAVAFVAWSRTSAPPEPAAAGSAAASIAVLPFVNMSGSDENEYFSDGLTETLLNMLAQVPELKVAARTSSFSFKGQNQDIRTIANALGVAHILEGSVQRAGDRIRITAQLIRADDGFHVWSESYDRTLDDIFRIQDEIAGKVGGALTSSLLPGGDEIAIAGVGTDDVEAYDLFLRAVAEQGKDSYGSLQASEALLKQALALDPDFSDAKTQLATNYFAQVLTGLREPKAAINEILALLEQVLVARPSDIRAQAWHHVATVVRAQITGARVDVEAAIDELRVLTDKAPSEVDPKRLLLQVLPGVGRHEEALAVMEDLLALDPLNPALNEDIGHAYWAMGDLVSAISALERAAELEPGNPGFPLGLAWMALDAGDLETYLRNYLVGMEIDPLDHEIPLEFADFLYALGLQQEGDLFRDRSVSIAPTSDRLRMADIFRAVNFEADEVQYELARQLIEDGAGWRDDGVPFLVLFTVATKNGTATEALQFVESAIPGFDDFGQQVDLNIMVARIWSLGAFRQVESPEDFAQRLDQIRHLIDQAVDAPTSRNSVLRMNLLALQGRTGEAIEVALTQVFTRPAVATATQKYMFEQPYMADVVSEPRVADAMRHWQADIQAAATEARAYLAGADLP